jgi:hypothetical protein
VAGEQGDTGSSVVPGRREARGYTWPPFEPGNTVSLRHGAFSHRVISEAGQQIRHALLESYPYLADDAFVEAIDRYCRAEARAQLLHDYITEKVDTEGVEAVKPYLWAEAGRAEANAQKFGSECGLDAAGHAKIARDLGLARNIQRDANARRTDELAATGRALRERRLKELGIEE